MMALQFVPAKNPIQRINPDVQARLIKAQQSAVERVFADAGELFNKIADDLKIAVPPPASFSSRPAVAFSDLPLKDLLAEIEPVLASAGVPESARTLQAVNFAYRVQLVRAFDNPDAVVRQVTEKVRAIVTTFPRTAEHIERGRNPGDVLDPYILAATQGLLYQGNFQGAVEATVAHKALMIIEGLMGHLHEEVIGEMRGNIKSPEPRGVNQEIIDPHTNPFPGADIVQPPLRAGEPIRFHQVKSKTGSAKGGDGKRLGGQLKVLQQYYGGKDHCEVYYDALIGNTLRGHRSMAGVLAEAPQVVVLVGASAFQSLTASAIGPELLLRVYQTAFAEAAHESGYHIDTMAAVIVDTFKARADAAGDGFLEIILRDSTGGGPEEQDSRSFIRGARRPRSASATEDEL
jgi:hypothetical protein